MLVEKHDLHHEFPEFHDQIHNLKVSNMHFAKLFTEYHDKDHEIHRIEQGSEVSSDDYLENLKKQRLLLKDQLFAMLQKAD
ncbi:YdcH family protein [Alishewanella tabrizica]|uniref:GTP-binding protein n=1 Tax=Alishewanella tabrizica TaxID=671278 RepID=A0ABQ2WCT1_9ALTE|nr:YdcH family protein [Alishewanella tabrizica]GGW49320.1 GTP-binding protein [Alishewanella tabrizica]